METPTTCSEMGSSPRRRPLHTAAASFISIATIAYQKAENLNIPPSSLLNKMTNAASLASPLIHASQRLLLMLLSFVDDWIILPLESTMEAVFPLWKYLFDKIDEVVQMVETLPGNFEDVLDKFPELVHQVPVLNMVLNHAIFWLKFFLSVLNNCGDSVKEKEIVVVENPNEASDEGTGIVHMVDQSTDQLQDFPAVGSCQGEIKDDFVPLPASQKAVSAGSDLEGTKSEAGSPKPSYKEALEKGSKESSPKNKEENIQVNVAEELEGKSKKSKENAEATEEGESLDKDDAILALFESAWLMMPPPKKGIEDSMPRSASYQW